MKFSWRYLVPLAVFAVLVVFLARGLMRDPDKLTEVPSPLIGKPAPEFRLARLQTPEQTLSPQDLRGQVWLLNVWAPWCTSCLSEHPLLVELSKSHAVQIIGLDYKDDPAAGRQWLQRHGNPYSTAAVDRDGRVGIDYGVYGVPETFIIDKKGVIRHKHIGAIDEGALRAKILPLIEQLKREG